MRHNDLFSFMSHSVSAQRIYFATTSSLSIYCVELSFEVLIMQHSRPYSLPFRVVCRIIKYSFLVMFGIGIVCVVSASVGGAGFAQALLAFVMPLCWRAFSCLFWLTASIIVLESIRS